MTTRRQFLQYLGVGAITGALGGPPFSRLFLEEATPSPPTPALRLALLADSHLPGSGAGSGAALNLDRAVAEINDLSPPVDLVLLAGDLTDTGDPEALELGREILASLRRPYWLVPGEKDVTARAAWRRLFGEGRFSFAHRGVHFLGLDTTDANPPAGSASFRLDRAQLSWLATELRQNSPESPLVILTHAPLYRLFRPWQWWTEDAELLHDLLRHHQQVFLLHGHVHQNIAVSRNHLIFQGLRATAWPLPDVRVGCLGAEPVAASSRGLAGCGWLLLTLTADGQARIEDRVWPA